MNYTEQQKLSQNTALQGFVMIGASRFANDFLAGEKIFPLLDETDPDNPISINQDANNYLNKMRGFCVRVLNIQANKQGGLINTIQNLLIILISDNLPITFSDFKKIDVGQFIQDNMAAFEAIILTCFERLSGISQKEKQKYDGIKVK